MIEMIYDQMLEHQRVVQKSLEEIQSYIYTACILATDTISNKKKILICGNGGSAADAQHIAAEIVGRYKKDRKGLPAIALTTDTSALTAIANDYGYKRVFDRQIEALANKDDLLIAISTSGNSKNIINAIKRAKEKKCKTIGLSGNDGGKMNDLCDINIVVPSNDTPRIQEMHILIGHIISQAIDDLIE